MLNKFPNGFYCFILIYSSLLFDVGDFERVSWVIFNKKKKEKFFFVFHILIVNPMKQRKTIDAKIKRHCHHWFLFHKEVESYPVNEAIDHSDLDSVVYQIGSSITCGFSIYYGYHSSFDFSLQFFNVYFHWNIRNMYRTQKK